MRSTPVIVIHSAFGLLPMLEYELEIAQRHLDEGARVVFLQCKGNVSQCHVNNPIGRPIKRICWACKSRVTAGLNWLNIDKGFLEIREFEFISPQQMEVIESCMSATKPDTLDSGTIRKIWNISDVDIYEAALSTMVGRYRNPLITPKDNATLFQVLLKTSLVAYFSFSNHINVIGPDLCYVFNGRIARYRPPLRLCQQLDLNMFSYEYPLVGYKRYSLFNGIYPHDLDAASNQFLDAYNSSLLSEKDKLRIGNWRYRMRTKGNRKPKPRPDGLSISDDIGLLNVLIATSTEYEYAGITGANIGHFYENQVDALQQIFSDLASEMTFVVRTHPNAAKDEWFVVEEMVQLSSKYSSVRVVLPNSNEDTYALVAQSDLVVTFGSTVGAEAAFMGKPVITIGSAFYKSFGLSVHPSSHSEVLSLLRFASAGNYRNFPVASTRYIGAVKFAFATMFFGVKSKYVRRDSYEGGGMLRGGKLLKLKPRMIFTFINTCAQYVGRIVRGTIWLLESTQIKYNELIVTKHSTLPR